ncbi:MAG: DUF3631 domain-containing protein [Sedimenticolaceae bacterium]
MAGIELHKKLPATTVSRSVVVHLERAADDELDEDDIYETRKHRVGILETGRRLARWCADAKQEIAGRDPTLPPKVRNRLADKWRPLFAIAEVAGSHWPDRARAALFAQPDLSEPSKGLQLLIDIRDVLDGKARNIATEDLIGMLANLDEAPWADYNFRQRDPEERRIQPRQLSGLLKRYGIGRGTVRTIERPNSAKGYRERDLAQAWKRYLPKEPLEKGSQSHSSITSTTCVGHIDDTAKKRLYPDLATVWMLIGPVCKGSSTISECAEFCRDLPRNIEVTYCQVDQVGERVQRAEAAGAVFHDFYDAVDPLGDGVGDPRRDKGEDAFLIAPSGVDKPA